MIWLSETAANLPHAWFYIRAPGPLFFVLYYGLLIAACAVGLVSGVLGGFMRLIGVSQLASMYAAATSSQQSGVLLIFDQFVSAHDV